MYLSTFFPVKREQRLALGTETVFQSKTSIATATLLDARVYLALHHMLLTSIILGKLVP